jgi:hypothetical protein
LESGRRAERERYNIIGVRQTGRERERYNIIGVRQTGRERERDTVLMESGRRAERGIQY